MNFTHNPDASHQYVLQQATSMSVQDWQPVVETPTVKDGVRQVNVTVPGAQIYFRLLRK